MLEVCNHIKFLYYKNELHLNVETICKQPCYHLYDQYLNMKPHISPISVGQRVAVTVCFAACIIFNVSLAMVMPRVHRSIWGSDLLKSTFLVSHLGSLYFLTGMMATGSILLFVLMWFAFPVTLFSWVLWEGLVWNMLMEVRLSCELIKHRSANTRIIRTPL